MQRWRLKPHQKTADAFLKSNASHPVIVKATAGLQRLLDEAAAYMAALGSSPHVAPYDYRTKRARELTRLRDGGATGSDLFRAALALHLYARTAFEPFSEAYRFALARAVLHVVSLTRHQAQPREVGRAPREQTNRLSTVMLRNLGRELAELLGVILHVVTKHVEAEASKPRPSRAQQIAAVVERQPFIS